jgi:hypothetical protein
MTKSEGKIIIRVQSKGRNAIAPLKKRALGDALSVEMVVGLILGLLG